MIPCILHPRGEAKRVAGSTDAAKGLWERPADDVTKLRRTPDNAEQRALTKKVVDRELDQVTRMWMPYDNGFLAFQPHLRNVGALAIRRNDGYGSSTLARLWIDK